MQKHRILFCQESQHPRRTLVLQLTRPQSQFNANQSIQIKMSSLSPQPRSNNNQRNLQTKISSTNYTQPAKNKEQSFGGRERKHVEEDGGRTCGRRSEQTNGLPEVMVKGRGYGAQQRLSHFLSSSNQTPINRKQIKLAELSRETHLVQMTTHIIFC